MAEIIRAVEIAATPEAVWAVISAPALAPSWMPDVKDRRVLTPGPVAPGTRWKEHGLLRGKSYEITYEVTEVLPPSRLAYEQAAMKAEGGYRWCESISIEAAGAGARVTARLDYHLGGGLASVLYERLLFRKDFGQTLENRLEALLEHLQGGR